MRIYVYMLWLYLSDTPPDYFSADELEKDFVVINFTWIKDALLREGWVVDGVVVTLRLEAETTVPLINRTTFANHGIILGQKVSGVEQNTWLIGPAFHLDRTAWVCEGTPQPEFVTLVLFIYIANFFAIAKYFAN